MLLKHLLIILGITTLVACSSDNSGANGVGGGRGGSDYGFLSLHITDAVYDDAAEIWIRYKGVELKPAPETSDQDTIYIPIDPPLDVNMMTLQGSDSTPLFSDAVLPTGMYEWVRLIISATDDGTMDSYIVLKDGSEHELDVPSGSESGLQINGDLEIIANTPSDKTIDFDLRRSIVMTGMGVYKLIPVMKLVDNDETGSIEGTVSPSVITAAGCPADPPAGSSVYLFEDFNVTPDDIDGIDPEPFDSSLVTLNNATGEYEYSFGFVPLGKYTISYTCQAGIDDPATDDSISFSTSKNLNIVNTDASILPGNTFR